MSHLGNKMKKKDKIEKIYTRKISTFSIMILLLITTIIVVPVVSRPIVYSISREEHFIAPQNKAINIGPNIRINKNEMAIDTKGFAVIITPPAFLVEGYCYYENMDPVNSVSVELINLDNSKEWQADVISNYYSIELTPGEDINASETLRIRAKDITTPGLFGYVDHIVTQQEIDSGVILLDITVNLTLADMNLDGAINGFDIDPFVLALVDPDGYETTYGVPADLMGDCNLDWVCNAFDIDPFVQILTTGTYPVWP